MCSCVSRVSCSTCLVPCVLVPHVPPALRGLVPHMHRALCAFVSHLSYEHLHVTCHVPRTLRDLVLLVPHLLQVYKSNMLLRISCLAAFMPCAFCTLLLL